MPEPLDNDDMPEIEDYESDYPVDDRHMIDSIYRMCVINNDAMADMYGSYRTVKVIAGVIIAALLAVIFGALVLTMAGVL